MASSKLVVLGMLFCIACKPPRSPREIAMGKVSGDWHATSAAAGLPADTGRLEWEFKFDERDGGRIEGAGKLARAGQTVDFTLDGLRGEHDLKMDFFLDSREARYHGSIADAHTIIGEVHLRGDTIPVTLQKRR